MAPKKATKRAAEAKAAGAPQKRQKLEEQAVEEALMMSMLPLACRDMLVAAAPHCLAVARDLRADTQTMLVEMIGTEVEGVRARLVAAKDAEAEGLAACVESKGELEAKAREAEAAATSAAETTQAKLVAATEAAEGVISAQKELREKKGAQRKGDIDFEKAKAKSAKFDKALNVDFAAVEQGEPEAIKVHFKALQPLLPELELDDSLLSALPATCGKAAAQRGDFDAVVVQQLRASLQDKVAAIEKIVSDGEPAAQARASEVEAAELALEAAKAAQQLAAEEHEAARKAQEEAEAASKAAQKAVKSHGPEVQRLSRLHDEASAALQQFTDYNLTCFEALRDRSSTPPPTPAAAEDQAASEAPAEAQSPAAAVEAAPATEEASMPPKIVDTATPEAEGDAPTAAAGA